MKKGKNIFPLDLYLIKLKGGQLSVIGTDDTRHDTNGLCRAKDTQGEEGA
jgi:hypothetical protein